MLRYLSDTCVSGVLGAFAIIGERADADNVYNQDQVPARSQNVTLPNQQNSNSRAELMHRCDSKLSQPCVLLRFVALCGDQLSMLRAVPMTERFHPDYRIEARLAWA